jgi:hypothetical protein
LWSTSHARSCLQWRNERPALIVENIEPTQQDVDQRSLDGELTRKKIAKHAGEYALILCSNGIARLEECQEIIVARRSWCNPHVAWIVVFLLDAHAERRICCALNTVKDAFFFDALALQDNGFTHGNPLFLLAAEGATRGAR